MPEDKKPPEDNCLAGLIPQTIYVSAEDFEFLLDLIANPPPPNEAMRKLMATPSPWEE